MRIIDKSLKFQQLLRNYIGKIRGHIATAKLRDTPADHLRKKGTLLSSLETILYKDSLSTVPKMKHENLRIKAWKTYEKAIEMLNRGDIRDAAEKAWLAVENMRKAIMVAAKIPYETTKKISIALNIFNGILKALNAETILEKYYYLQATLHGLSFYEGILNEDITIDAILKAEEWLKETEKLINKAWNMDTKLLMNIKNERRKIQAEELLKSKELINSKKEE